MAKAKLYVYQVESCRGFEETYKTVLDLDKVLALVDEGLAARKKGEDELDEFIEERIEDNEDISGFEEGTAIAALVRGSDCDSDSTRKINGRVKKVREGKSFFIFNEESTIGYGATKKDAREACLCADGEEW